MARANDMSSVLVQFDNSGVIDGLSSIESAKSSVATTVNSVLSVFSDLSSSVKSTFLDSAGDSLYSSFNLLRDASSRLHSSIESDDMPRIITETRSVGKIVQEIKASRAEIQNIKVDWEVEEIDSTAGAYKGNEARYNRLNDYITYLNREGEKQLSAIINAAASVNLGIIGNMKYGGSLGSKVSFGDNYNYTRPAFVDTPPAAGSGVWNFFKSIAGAVGTFMVGSVEGVIKFGEGVIDAGLTAASWVTNVIGLTGASNALANAAKYDVAGNATNFAYTWLKENGAYNEFARGAGILAGQVTAAIAVNAVTFGAAGGIAGAMAAAKTTAIVSAISAGGQSSEGMLQAGKSINVAFGTGVVVGAIGMILPKIGERLMTIPIVSRITSSNIATGVKTVFSKVANSLPVQGMMLPAKILARVQTTVGMKVFSAGGAVVSKVASPIVGFVSKTAAKMFPETAAKISARAAAKEAAQKAASFASIKSAAAADTTTDLKFTFFGEDKAGTTASKNFVKNLNDSRAAANAAYDKATGTYVFADDASASAAIDAMSGVHGSKFNATTLKPGSPTTLGTDLNQMSYYGKIMQDSAAAHAASGATSGYVNPLTTAELNTFQASAYNAAGYENFVQAAEEQAMDLFMNNYISGQINQALNVTGQYTGAVVGAIVQETK